jgi:signal transduction histidine kinase
VENDLTILLIGTTVMFLVISALILFVYLYQKRLIKQKGEKKELEELLKSEELKSTYSLLEGQDNERERIAQDLHDRMGGQLSTIKIYLDLLSNTPSSGRQNELLQKLHEATDSSIHEVRTIAHDLSSSSLTIYGLSKSIEHLCRAISDSKKLEATLFSSITTEIPKQVARDVYLILQELITNTLKHAEAQTIRIDLTAVEEELNIIYQDDGKGFELFRIENRGMGLEGLRLRIKKYRGNLNIESEKNQGSTFIIEIPLTKDE